MKNALILHGAGNNSQGNWFPWLKQELFKKGYKVWSPNLPDSDTPKASLWLDTIFSNKDWQFNDHSTLIGHSSGATLILRILEALPKGVIVDKAILVAGFINKGTLPQYFKYKQGLLKLLLIGRRLKNPVKNLSLLHQTMILMIVERDMEKSCKNI